MYKIVLWTIIDDEENNSIYNMCISIGKPVMCVLMGGSAAELLNKVYPKGTP